MSSKYYNKDCLFFDEIHHNKIFQQWGLWNGVSILTPTELSDMQQSLSGSELDSIKSTTIFWIKKRKRQN